MAEVCIELRMAPSEYWSLTGDEEEALFDALREWYRRKAKGGVTYG